MSFNFRMDDWLRLLHTSFPYNAPPNLVYYAETHLCKQQLGTRTYRKETR